MGQINDLDLQGLGGDAEFALIKKTFLNLQLIDKSRKGVWIQTLGNDLLAPIYYSKVENFKYSHQNPFVIDRNFLEQLRDKDYESIKKPKIVLQDALLHILYEFVELFNIDLIKIQRFILAVCENYQENPFHNFYHAFAVVQMLYTIGEKNAKFSRFFAPEEYLSLLISALGHDLNHPGVTNVFMINSRHPLAVRYNDNSVLENHHASVLIKFLELPGCDIFKDSECDITSMRKTIISTILATDMAMHNFVIEHFVGTMRKFDKDCQEHRQSVADMLLHSCDVGNPVVKFEIATIWSLKIIQEFNDQVWKEEQSGIPVSEFMRIGSDINKIKRNQIGFIDMFISPLWMVLSQHLEGLKEYENCIEENRVKWEELEKFTT